MQYLSRHLHSTILQSFSRQVWSSTFLWWWRHRAEVVSSLYLDTNIKVWLISGLINFLILWYYLNRSRDMTVSINPALQLTTSFSLYLIGWSWLRRVRVFRSSCLQGKGHGSFKFQNWCTSWVLAFSRWQLYFYLADCVGNSFKERSALI